MALGSSSWVNWRSHVNASVIYTSLDDIFRQKEMATSSHSIVL